MAHYPKVNTRINYRSYVCQLRQSDTYAPQPTILHNDLGYEPTWSRTSAGQYILSSTELAAENTDKVVVFLNDGLCCQGHFEDKFTASHAYYSREEGFVGITTARIRVSIPDLETCTDLNCYIEEDDILSDGSKDDFFRASFELRIYS